tara:strand:+ start:94 stop:903 length:810 start_codon:yes stop_codon:yes gene_type:complete
MTNPTALKDWIVVITGTLEGLTSKEAEELVVKAGGKVASSVSEDTDLVITGGKAGSEVIKAKELEIPVRRGKDLMKIVNDCFGLFLSPAEPEKDHEPDWEEDLIKGEKLARCAQQLLSKHDPEVFAPLLGYKYMDSKGHDQPLVGHLMQAIKDAGVDLEEDEVNTDDMIGIWKGKLIQAIDGKGIKVHIPKTKYDEYPQEYDHACNWEELSEEDWSEIYEYSEPMVEGDLTVQVYLDEELEFSEVMDDEEIFEYYDIPTKDIHESMRYG